MNPKISVIVPVYNTEPYLSACLDSLLAQTEKDFEILAVENGCTDRSAELLEAYAAHDDRIRVIHRRHGEVYEARNSALPYIRGKYLAFCDSDDTVPRTAFAMMLARAERSGCDVVTGGYYRTEDGTPPFHEALKPGKNSLFRKLLEPPCVWNKLIRYEFLQTRELVFPELVMGEDVVFLAKLIKCLPKTEWINAPVYNYWHHVRAFTPSMTHRYSYTFFKLHLRCREELLREMEGTQFRDEAHVYVAEMIAFLRAYLYKIWDTGEREAAFELFREHVLSLSWTGGGAEAPRYLGMDLQEFSSASAEYYLLHLMNEEPRNEVLREYQEGNIGFQYIFKYTREWARFKLRRFNHEKGNHIRHV